MVEKSKCFPNESLNTVDVNQLALSSRNWRAERYGSSWAVIDDRGRIAYVYGVFADRPDEEAKVNTELMASAPALRAALIQIASRHHSDTCSLALTGQHECDCHVSIAKNALRSECSNR
jgi:hypothetical protein